MSNNLKLLFNFIFILGAVFIAPKMIFGKSTQASNNSVLKNKLNSNIFSGSAILDVSRSTDINHSKILSNEDPNKRTDYSLAAILNLTAINEKNTYTISQVFTKDFVRNNELPHDQDWSVKNLRIGWTRSTDFKLNNSFPLSLPFSVVLPTTSASREMGSLGSFRFWPVLTWQIDEVLFISYSFQSVFAFQERSTQAGVLEETLKNSTLLLNNTVIFGFVINQKVKLSQSLGISSSGKGIDKLLDLDQTGSSFSLSSGISLKFTEKFYLDLSVNQSAPLQGDGLGAVKVYENNDFRPYHTAQSFYGLTSTFLF